MQFASKCAVFQILLEKIHLYFCVPFPLTSNFSSLSCQNVHTTQHKIDIANISEAGKIIQTRMKHFLLLWLRNATKHNSIKYSATRLHVSTDKL